MTATIPRRRPAEAAPARAPGVALRPPRIEYPADGSVRPVARLVWRPVETASISASPSEALRGKRVAIVSGTEELAARIAAVLEAHGAASFRFPNNADDEELAAAELVARAGGIDGIVDLNVTGVSLEETVTPAGSAAWEAPLRRTVALLKACYVDWAQETDAARLFYLPVTLLGGRMGYTGEGVLQPMGGIWAGLAKTLPREIPNGNVRVLDLSPEHFREAEQIIARELYRPGLFEIGYHEGKRYTLAPWKEEPGLPTHSLRPADTILMSGGARGIGFALATALARNFGCCVVVTGRLELPTGTEPWLRLDEFAFKEYQRELLRSAPPGKTVAQMKREGEQLRRRRELYKHLQQVEADGLRIEYRVCDFNHPEEVRALVEEIGPALGGVIHNAGVDVPVRLPGKSLDTFVDTVRVKVAGFWSLFHALRDQPLKFFCAVGSLTGRYGGMIGELDYAAANEGLARLSLWAAKEARFPIVTVAWPTWERLGNIANFHTAVKYMSALNVEEGVYHWQRELLAGTRGEVTFVGQVGSARTPIILGGNAPSPDLPSIESLYRQYHYLGRVLEFAPFRCIRTRVTPDARAAPCLTDLTFAGAPALPVSLLLEYALRLGDWVAPEQWSELLLHEIADVEICLPQLTPAVDGLEFESEAAGSWDGDAWVVAVRITRVHPERHQELGRLRLVYRRGAAAQQTVPLPPAPGTPVRLAPPPYATWSGFVFPLARWRRQADGALVGEVRPCDLADLWTTPYLPDLRLPVTHLENIVRAILAQRQAAEPPGRLILSRMTLTPGMDTPWQMLGTADGASWLVTDREGRIGLRLEGVGFARDI